MEAPTFYGYGHPEEDPEEFIETIEYTVSQYPCQSNIETGYRITFRLHLKDPSDSEKGALSWYNELDRETKKDWTKLKGLFIAKYSVSTIHALGEETDTVMTDLIIQSPRTSNDENVPVTSPLSKQGLKFAPAEIREQIFAFVFKDLELVYPVQDHEFPALLKALYGSERHGRYGIKHCWGDKQLYDEALLCLKKKALFRASWSYEERGMWGTVQGNEMRRLSIKCSEEDPEDLFPRNCFMFTHNGLRSNCPQGPSKSIRRILSMTSKVTDLHLDFPFRISYRVMGGRDTGQLHIPVYESMEEILCKAKQCITSFPKLRKFSIALKHPNTRHFAVTIDSAEGQRLQNGSVDSYDFSRRYVLDHNPPVPDHNSIRNEVDFLKEKQVIEELDGRFGFVGQFEVNYEPMTLLVEHNRMRRYNGSASYESTTRSVWQADPGKVLVWGELKEETE